MTRGPYQRSARRQERVPPVVVTVRLRCLLPAAKMIRERMSRIFDAHKCAAYLFVDAAGDARLLYETQSSLPAWSRAHETDLVGCYVRRVVSEHDGGWIIGAPDADAIASDLREHLRGLNQGAAKAGCARG